MPTDSDLARNRGRMLVIDGHSLAHRAFYALPLLSSSTGTFTNAVQGFATMLMRVLSEEKPTHAVVAFDTPAPTFRHLKSEDYKAHRKPMPDELRPQIDLIREMVPAFGVCKVEEPGFEADDLIGTIATKAEAQGIDVVIVTGDRDALQLVSPMVTVMLTRKGISEVDRFTPALVLERYGVTPSQIPDMKGLMGDASDNIPGVPGVGEKTAVKLIQQFGSVESLLERIDEVTPARVKATLEANPELARLSKDLATIHLDAPLPAALDEMSYAGPRPTDLHAFLERLELRALLRRVADTGFGRPTPSAEARPQKPPVNAAQDGREASPDGAVPPGDGTAQDALNVGLNGRPTGEGDSAAGASAAAPAAPIDIQHLTASEFLAAWSGIPAGLYAVDALLPGAHMAWALRALALTPVSPSSDDPPCVMLVAPDLDAGETEDDLFLAVKGFLGSTIHAKAMHDAKPLCTYSHLRGTDLKTLTADTLVAGYLLTATAKTYDLGDLAAAYGVARPPAQPTLDLSSEHTEGLRAVACDTAERCRAIGALAPAMLSRLVESGLTGLYSDMELPVVAVLAEMEANGIRVDTSRLGELSKALGARLAALEVRVYQAAGERFNINSPKQLADLLFVKLGLPPKKKTTTGFSTDVDVLEELSEQHELPGLILDYRQLAKLKSTYADSLAQLVNPGTGRIHTTYNQVVAVTGRLSSTDPNLQNIPKRTEEGRRIRQVFTPSEPGWVLLAGDYSQIELRVLAHFSGDETLVSSFLAGEDIHARTASEVFGVPLGDVTRDLRDAAKAVNFGIVYGQTGFGLARSLGISRMSAQEYIDNYLGRYPGIKRYMSHTVATARETGESSTLLGRRRALPDIHSRKFATRQFAERTAINTPIQGTAADIMKAAMVAVHARMHEEEVEARLLLQVHDELVLECPATAADILGGIVKDTMENVVKLLVPLKVELKIGPNWRDMETAG